METGESPQEALKREIREELDADVLVKELLDTVEWDYPNFHLTMHCFICNLLSESLHLNEHEAAAWLNLENLRSVKWLPADEILLDKIADYLRQKDFISPKRCDRCCPNVVQVVKNKPLRCLRGCFW